MAMPRLCLALLVVCMVRGKVGGHEDGAAQGRVLELTDSTFDSAIAKYDHILVEFYAPWCGHCRRLSPELDAAASGLAASTPPIVIAKLNADKYTKLASRYSVSAYPTLKVFINGFPIDYTGPRKVASLSSHLYKLVNTDVKEFGNEFELQEFLQKADDSFPFFVAFGLPKSCISEVAEKYKSKAWFLVVDSFSENVMNQYDFDKSPAIVALRRNSQEQEIFYGPFEGEDLVQFVQQNLLPRVNYLTGESIRSVREDGRPVALTILKDASSGMSVEFVKRLKAAAPANRAFIFAYVDVLKWPSFAANFRVDERSNLPALVVWDGDSSYYVSAEDYDYSGEKSDSLVTYFLQEFKDGKSIKHEFQGPSFMEFVKSLISMKSVYIIILIFGLLLIAQNKWASNSNDMGSTIHFGEQSHQHNSSLGNPGILDTPSSRNKEE